MGLFLFRAYDWALHITISMDAAFPISRAGGSVKSFVMSNRINILLAFAVVLVIIVISLSAALHQKNKENINATSMLRYIEKEAAQNRNESNFAQTHSSGGLAAVTDESCTGATDLIGPDDSHNYLLAQARDQAVETAVSGKKAISDNDLTRSLAGL